MTRKNTKFNFEESLNSLESLVEAMEAGDLSLEEALKAFEQGIKLTRECQQALEQAEQKVQLLLAKSDVPIAVPFNTEDDGMANGSGDAEDED
jgi:exodeoxyribonuclease VII small subunit